MYNIVQTAKVWFVVLQCTSTLDRDPKHVIQHACNRKSPSALRNTKTSHRVHHQTNVCFIRNDLETESQIKAVRTRCPCPHSPPCSTQAKNALDGTWVSGSKVSYVYKTPSSGRADNMCCSQHWSIRGCCCSCCYVHRSQQRSTKGSGDLAACNCCFARVQRRPNMVRGQWLASKRGMGAAWMHHLIHMSFIQHTSCIARLQRYICCDPTARSKAVIASLGIFDLQLHYAELIPVMF